VDNSKQLCTFRLNSHLFGVGVQHVQEVVRQLEMTPVPLAHPAIRGLINLRGQIVTAVDMRRRFGYPALEEGAKVMNMVIKVGEGAVSLLVDEIGDVVDVDATAFEKVPESVADDAKELVSAVYKLEDELMLVLDAEKVAGIGPVMSEV